MRRVTSNNNDKIGVDNYLTMVALEDGLTAKLSVNACEYCVDGNGNWKSLPTNTETESINAGQTLSFRGNLTPTSSDGIGTFTVNKYFNLKGNGMSLLFGDNGKDSFSLSGKNCAFKNLFSFNSKLVDASEFVLQATILERECYNKLFIGCNSLTKAPQLPATTLMYACYQNMFYNCRSLVIPPILPATTLATACYVSMFQGCTNLNVAPVLPATTLISYCYQAMFQNCTSLTKAPDLPATSLAQFTYNNMFKGCSNINYIKMLAITITNTNNVENWVDGVSTTGTFVKNKDATWDIRGVSGIPDGWEVIIE